MSFEGTSNQLQIKQANRMTIVRSLCAGPGLSRSELADAVGLTRSTVTTLVRELLAEGWLMEQGTVATGEVGRRPTPLFIDPHRLFLLGAEVGVGQIRVVATSLTGQVLDRRTESFDPAGTPQACIEGLCAVLLDTHQRVVVPGRRLIGVGVGLPGGVDETRGLLKFAPNLGWHELPVGAWLSDGLSRSAMDGVPLFVQNEADAAAVGEIEFNAAECASPLLYLSINQGLGAGVVVGDKLLAGGQGVAGEVGHIVLEIEGPPCSCGRRGCAEALINARASSGDPDALGEAGRYLGVLLQNLAAAYDPGCIVLGGELVDLGDGFLGPALDTLGAYTSAAKLRPPAVRTSRHGSDAVAVGAAALVRYRLTRLSGASAWAPGSQQPMRVHLHHFQRLGHGFRAD